MARYDALIVGAGFAGAVAAGELARRGGKTVLVLERRDHIGGNAYDRLDPAGVLIHRYGPHIFHTNDKRVYDHLSRYTAWTPYQHRVAASLPDGKGGRLQFPVPFNLTSLEIAFGRARAAELEKKLVETYSAEKKVAILELRQSPDADLAALADYVYEHVFVHYTMKQWGQRPEDVDPATTARVPVFLSRDDRYFQDTYQGMPRDGYAALFENLLDHPGVTVELGTDARDRLTLTGDGGTLLDGELFSGPVVYTGAVDELFSRRFGPLPYRTLDFRFETLEQDFFQSHATVNYTVDEPFTRITEFKRLTGQKIPGVTTIVREFSRPCSTAPGEVPCYAIINEPNNALYAKYKAQADRYPNLYLLGRLAEYKYYNMDAIAGRSLALADQLLGA